MSMSTFSSALAVLLLLWSGATTVVQVNAHVLMVYPTPRTDNDYLYSFEEGVCRPPAQDPNNVACDAFCGDPYNTQANPVTTLPVGIPITLQWMTNVAHVPYEYRLSLNPHGGDANFSAPENILTVVTNSDAADSTNTGYTGSFSTMVTIPESALETCNEAAGHDPCVLQLWDHYFFVSCANVYLTESMEYMADNEEATTAITTPSPQTQMPTSALPERTESTLWFEGASFDDYRVTIGQEEDESVLDPVLYLERCRDYQFVINAPGHPFVLKSQPGIGLDHLIVQSNYTDINETSADTIALSEKYYSALSGGGMERGQFTFRALEVGSLFYQCTLHEGMGSKIFIINSNNYTCDADLLGQEETPLLMDVEKDIDDETITKSSSQDNSGAVATISINILVLMVGATMLLQ